MRIFYYLFAAAVFGFLPDVYFQDIEWLLNSLYFEFLMDSTISLWVSCALLDSCTNLSRECFSSSIGSSWFALWRVKTGSLLTGLLSTSPVSSSFIPICPVWTGLVPVYLSTVSWPLTIFFSLRFTFKCFDVFLPAFRLMFGVHVSSPDLLWALTAEFGIIAMFVDWKLLKQWLYNQTRNWGRLVEHLTQPNKIWRSYIKSDAAT